MVYSPDGLLWDADGVFDPVEHTYVDWMHTFCASGGIGQVVLNAFCKALVKIGIVLAEIDAFVGRIVWPKRLQPLQKDFFQCRVQLKGGHLKCFAGETLQAVEAVCCFVDLVLLPSGKLPNHARCVKMLGKVLGIYSFGDGGIAFIGELHSANYEFHVYFLLAFGVNLAKPKLHLTYHCALNFEKHLRNMNCFNPERQHRQLRRLPD